MNPWLLAQLVVSGALAGLCWTVQLAVYAQFGRLILGGDERFRDYHAAYTRGIGYVAGPLMIAELALAAGWFLTVPESAAARVAGGAVVLLWLHTFVLMVPLHNRIQAQPMARLARRLTALNWMRTALWTFRAGVLLAAASGRMLGV